MFLFIHKFVQFRSKKSPILIKIIPRSIFILRFKPRVALVPRLPWARLFSPFRASCCHLLIMPQIFLGWPLPMTDFCFCHLDERRDLILFAWDFSSFLICQRHRFAGNDSLIKFTVIYSLCPIKNWVPTRNDGNNVTLTMLGALLALQPTKPPTFKNTLKTLS